MKSRMVRWFYIFVALSPISVLLGPWPVLAQEKTFALGASMSIVTPTERHILGDKFELKREPMPEVQFAIFLNDSWSVEASYGGYEMTIRSKSTGIDYGELTVLPVRASLQYRHNYGDFPPYWDTTSYYIEAGVDYFVTDFETDTEIQDAMGDSTFDIEVDNKVGGHIAAGFDLFLAEAVSFSMNLKYWLAKSEVESEGSAGSDDADFELSGYSAGAGFKLFF
jgi:outer membrane protein W